MALVKVVNLQRMVHCALHSHAHTPQTRIINSSKNKPIKYKWINVPFLASNTSRCLCNY